MPLQLSALVGLAEGEVVFPEPTYTVVCNHL